MRSFFKNMKNEHKIDLIRSPDKDSAGQQSQVEENLNRSSGIRNLPERILISEASNLPCVLVLSTHVSSRFLRATSPGHSLSHSRNLFSFYFSLSRISLFSHGVLDIF